MTRRPTSIRVARAAAAAAVCAALALLATWAAPRASDAAASWMQAPPVRIRTLSLPDGLAVTRPQSRGSEEGVSAALQAGPHTLDAGMRFTMAGLICDVPITGDVVTVRLRTSLDGDAWGPWFSAPLERAAESGAPEQAFTEALWTGSARFIQVSAQAASDGAPLELGHARLVTIDSVEDADGGAAVLGALRRAAAAVASLSLAPPAGASVARPAIVTRKAWGANESWRKGSPDYATVKMAFVHHTASGNKYTADQAPAVVRGVYAYHTKSLGWSDVGYNFLVDRYGTVYEGRYGGMERGVIGAQVYGFNTGSTGISVIGTFSKVVPPPAAMRALQRLLAWKLSLHGLNPLGTATLTCGASSKFKKGARVTFPVIAGHRQANYTECPGTQLYGLLPTVRVATAGLVEPTVITGLSVASRHLSPNGDGVQDAATVSARISRVAAWTIAIRDRHGGVVRTYDGRGRTARATWPGTDGTGARVPDGTYRATVSATSVVGEAAERTTKLYVDTLAPQVTGTGLRSPWFSPNGDSRLERCRLTYTTGETADLRVSVLDASYQVQRRLTGWRETAAGQYETRWDGRITRNGRSVVAPDGPYRLRLELRDAAGNLGKATLRVVLDRTLGFPKAAPTTFSPDGDGTADSTLLRFRLTRRATVTIVVTLDDIVVRTLKPGTLSGGGWAVVWNGKTTGGKTAANERYRFTVNASSSLGKSSVSSYVTVDR